MCLDSDPVENKSPCEKRRVTQLPALPCLRLVLSTRSYYTRPLRVFIGYEGFLWGGAPEIQTGSEAPAPVHCGTVGAARGGARLQSAPDLIAHDPLIGDGGD